MSVFNLSKNSPNLRDLLPESPSKNAVPSCAEYGVVGVSTGLIGILQVNEIIKIILKKGEILDGTILIFNLLNMNMKKLNLKSDQLNKQIKNLSQFEAFIIAMNIVRKIMKLKVLMLMTLIVYTKQNPTKFF